MESRGINPVGNKENRKPEILKPGMAVKQKKPFGFSNNDEKAHQMQQRQAMQPLGREISEKENVKSKSSNILKDQNQKPLGLSQKDSLKNIVNPVVPCNQFKSFSVYEDDNVPPTKPDNKSSKSIYNGTNNDRFYTKSELAQLGLRNNEVTVKNEYNPFPTACVKPTIADQSLSDYKTDDKIEVDEDTKTSKVPFYFEEEYQQDIWAYLKQRELLSRPKPEYMKKQPDITVQMRTILVDWLVEVAEEYKMHTETLYLAVNFVDRFLSYMSVVRAKLQLVGTAAMFLASKYEEIYPPEVTEFVYITDDTYTKRQITRMEHLILKVLEFDVSIPTPLVFISLMHISNNITTQTKFLAMYLSELGLLKGESYLGYLPSVVAASAIALARHTLNEAAWSLSLAQTSGYELRQLEGCIRFLSEAFEEAPSLAQHAIQDKYKSKTYSHVSTLQPRATPIDFIENTF
ncbi:unnamed protein product [Phyllotreta striolata]|uniref:Cyclin A n=1 Tax=Phyllotreta striolata TaxID=444603 RepID=A0A9N9TL76_PHYSR|nr:unnamed protein product [Phyllotreta striolata]